MSILNWFNKPKWQSNNEQVRLTAVRHSTAAELKAHLADIVFHDNSPKVQKAALNRITELSLLLDIVKKHPDSELQQLADKRLSHLLALITAEEQTEAHITVAQQLQSNQAKAHLIEHGQALPLRMAAVAGLNRQGLLGDLMLSVHEPELHHHILDRINQTSTLKRVAAQLGTKQGALKDAIKEKIQDDNPVDPAETAQDLCQQLEQVVLKNQNLDIKHIEQQWHQLPQDKLPDKLMTRYQGALNTAKMTLDSDYREAFLKQQKHQRQQHLVEQLSDQLKQADAMSLSQLQQAVDQYRAAQVDLLPEAQQQHWQQMLSNLEDRLHAAQQAAQAPAECHTILTALDRQLQQTTVSPNKLKQFKQQWQQATKKASDTTDMLVLQEKFNDGIRRLADKITATAERRQQAAQQAIDLIEPIAKKIKDGQLTEAKSLINELNKCQKEAGFNHPNLKKHKFAIDQLWQQLKELRQWQQWSHDKVRQQMIEELHQLVASDMHPDAVLQKLQQANQQWSDLEDMEKLPGDRYSPRNQKQWQAFRTVSQALFERAQPFFEKRSEQQTQHLNNINQHIKTMHNADLETASPPELSQLVKTAVNYLKNLDKLSPKDRGQSAKALRHEMNRINVHLAEGYDKAENNKRQLIEQAQALDEVEDLSVAINSAKELQKQWSKAGYVSPKTERQLWKKFRRANDRVFNRRQQQQKAQQAEIEAHKKKYLGLLKSTRAQLNKCRDIESLDQLHSQFNSDWQQLARDAKVPHNDRQKLVQDIAQKRQQLTAAQIHKDIQQWQAIDALYSRHEQGELSAHELHQTLSEKPTHAQTVFTDRTRQNTDTDKLLILLIAGEYLTGLDTPRDYLDDRMAYQVNVLADRMAGEDSHKQVHEKALNWLHQWLQQPKGDADFMQQQQKRIETVCRAVIDVAVSD